MLSYTPIILHVVFVVFVYTLLMTLRLDIDDILLLHFQYVFILYDLCDCHCQ